MIKLGLYGAQNGFVRVNNSIIEEKSLSSGFNLVPPIKRERWFLFFGDSVNSNFLLFKIFYETFCLFQRDTTKP